MFVFRIHSHLTLVNLLIVSSITITCADCYRILGIFPHSGKSHFHVFEPLLLQLANKGHEVTVISYFPQKNPPASYYDVSLVGTTPALTNMIPFGMMGGGTLARLTHLLDLAYFTGHACENTFKSQEFNAFIQRQEKYDIVLTEFFTPHCLIGLMQNTGGSLVGLTSSFMLPWSNDYVANPDNPAFLPSVFIGCSDSMNFWERTMNVIFYVWSRGIYHVLMYRPANKEAKEKIDPSLPDLNEFLYNASLILVNVHHSLHPSKPLMPSVIEVGGMHIGEVKTLPSNLEKWINESTDGVIYFSMGSMLKGHTFPEDKRTMFQNSFSKLKQRVLWKWENETMPNKPDNVLIQKWMPQFDILCHPNVKAFITHGGLLGTTEAVHCGVPAVVMPQFGDQYTNAKALEASGGGVILDLSTMTEQDVYNALKTVLDPSFNKQAKELSVRFKDRPMPPLETAIYWIEYVARHKGAPHLRSAAVGMPYYQYLLLDVIAFLTFIGLAITYILYTIFTFFLRKIFKRETKKLKKQ